MVLSVTAWHYDPPVWCGSTDLMESEGVQALAQHSVQLSHYACWDDQPGDDDRVWCGVRLTLH
jgi:hypothetical protein